LAAASAGEGMDVAEIRAEMAANVWKVLVADGDAVVVGQTLVILESMKMEINVDAETAGTVTVSVAEGESIQEGDVIVTVE
jgi:acetyl-CoA carboxylase biotin carboxyl carrier protein